MQSEVDTKAIKNIMDTQVKDNCICYKYNGHVVGYYEKCNFNKVRLYLWNGDSFSNEGYVLEGDAKNKIENRRQLFILEGWWN